MREFPEDCDASPWRYFILPEHEADEVVDYMSWWGTTAVVVSALQGWLRDDERCEAPWAAASTQSCVPARPTRLQRRHNCAAGRWRGRERMCSDRSTRAALPCCSGSLPSAAELGSRALKDVEEGLCEPAFAYAAGNGLSGLGCGVGKARRVVEAGSVMLGVLRFAQVWAGGMSWWLCLTCFLQGQLAVG